MADYLREGYVFLKFQGPLKIQERLGIATAAVLMYLDNIQQKKVRGDYFEGVIEDTGERALLGSFVGRKFSASLNTEQGDASLEFIVLEEQNPSNN